MDIEELSHEDYLILMAKQALHENPLESKAWMITAKSLYTKNFAIQFEAYAIEKISNNCKDAAKHFSELFRQFQDNDKLWEEVNLMMTALCTNSPTDEQTFLKGVFTNIPLEIQYNLLLVAAERSTSVIQHCHLVLLLLKTFPEKLDQHCQKLIATLMKAEQHFYEQNPLNPFRKLFVCDLQPLIAASTIIKTPQLFKILTNCIDFYLVYIIKTSENQTQDILFTDCIIEDPWNSMFNVFKTIGRQLGWELYDLFTSSLGKKNIWQKISRYATHCYEKKSNYRQLVFSSMILFIHCLFDYNTSVESGTGGQRTDSDNLVLLESISSDIQKSEYPAKKAKS
uniref:Integrator complex subunit 10 n=1 Tax=Clastoptera arizonana TaxID=38151 RepID=A0A1B6D0Y1_9HEMI